MHRWIAWHDGPGEWPVFWILHQLRHAGIVNDVETDLGKGVSFPFFLLEHMIVRLMLKPLRSEQRSEMRSQKGHAVELVRVQTQSHPDQMQMIRHEAIRRAKQSLARGGVQHQFPKRGVKPLVQPAASTMREGNRPMNHRVALIVFAWETRKIESAVEVWFIHGDAASYGKSARESRAIVAADVRRL